MLANFVLPLFLCTCSWGTATNVNVPRTPKGIYHNIKSLCPFACSYETRSRSWKVYDRVPEWFFTSLNILLVASRSFSILHFVAVKYIYWVFLQVRMPPHLFFLLLQLLVFWLQLVMQVQGGSSLWKVIDQICGVVLASSSPVTTVLINVLLTVMTAPMETFILPASTAQSWEFHLLQSEPRDFW